MTIKRKTSPDKLDVKRRAAGRWDSILRKIMPQLAEAIETGHKKKVACPFHSGDTESNLRVLPDFLDTGGVACNTCGTKPDGYATLMWSGMSFDESVRAVADELDGVFGGLSPEILAKQQAEMEARRRETARQQVIDDKHYRRRLNEVWTQSVPLEHPSAEPGRLYLKKRGLYGLKAYPSELRFHPSLKYKDDKADLGNWPALVARLSTLQGTPGSLLRMYVAPNGDKPPLPDRKKMMSAPSTTSLTGGAIRLSAASTVLGIAEGVETALAVNLLFGINCWSSFSAQLMEGFEPPCNVEKVLVFADKDRNGRGEQAARVLVERLWRNGITAGIRMPEDEIPPGAKGIDWLDVLVGQQPYRDVVPAVAVA
jgi:hypothetical protein